MFRLTVALLLTTLTSGCFVQHVRLAAPAATAPLDERMAAYRGLQPVALSQTLVHQRNQYGAYVGSYVQTNHLQLRVGALVQTPEDLLPVVLPDSPTARFAQSYLRSRRGARWSWVTSALLSGIGLGITLSAVSAIDTGSDAQFNRRLIMGGVVSGVGIVAMLPAYIFGFRANRDRVAAFSAYPHDLPARLGLCEDERDEVFDCAQASPAGYGSMPVWAPETNR